MFKVPSYSQPGKLAGWEFSILRYGAITGITYKQYTGIQYSAEIARMCTIVSKDVQIVST